MEEGFDGVYRDEREFGAVSGDVYVGVPVEQSTVELVAQEYSLREEMIARALRDVEQTPNVLELGVVFTLADPLPVGADERGHLYLVGEFSSLWEVAADRLGLTNSGRDAVAEAHDRHVRKRARKELELDAGSGVIVVCPSFPTAAIQDALAVRERTRLTGRQVTVWALSHQALASSAISEIVGIPEAVVESELAAVDREARRVARAARTLDTPQSGLSRLVQAPNSSEWLGLDWSAWVSLTEKQRLLKELREVPGVYKIRHTDVPGTLYIGESVNLRDRVGHGLGSDLVDRGSSKSNHGASDTLRCVGDIVGGSLEVSVAAPHIVADKRHRLGVEAALVASCRREMGFTPPAMLNRDLVPESRTSSTEFVEELLRRAEAESREAPTWREWRSVRGSNWMGLEWTAPRPLNKREEVGDPGECVFRIWDRETDSGAWGGTLTLVGTAKTPKSKLFTLQQTHGDSAQFSVAPISDLSPDPAAQWRELEEIRYDLAGAHFLAAGEPPEELYRGG